MIDMFQAEEIEIAMPTFFRDQVTNYRWKRNVGPSHSRFREQEKVRERFFPIFDSAYTNSALVRLSPICNKVDDILRSKFERLNKAIL